MLILSLAYLNYVSSRYTSVIPSDRCVVLLSLFGCAISRLLLYVAVLNCTTHSLY
jgi:hypothetical protein